LKYKISLLDATAFSCEQDCRRKKQELQELIKQKERLEKLIANILNNDDNEEGYSKLKQNVRENVKAVLSENKQVVSIAFIALIQTLKTNPELVNLIYNIPRAKDEQRKDNNYNDAIKYLESNKDRMLGLVEKNYENLVEVFTNNAIENIANASSFNSALSLPSSSSAFPSPLNQNDTCRIEESEDFHNDNDDNKWDIAD
jgi:sugar-specific transcriptional regulator TrmB